MLTISMEVPAPKLGQLIYVPSTESNLGGLATIAHTVGSAIVEVRELPLILFDWEDLVKNQLEYVRLHGGSIARSATRRVA